MTEARSRRDRLEARAAQIEAELESRKTASEKAADRILNPTERPRGAAWETWKGTAV
jgi:hypothetical protein